MGKIHPRCAEGWFSCSPPQSRACRSAGCRVTSPGAAGQPSCTPAPKPPPSPTQPSPRYYPSGFFSPHKTPRKNKSGPKGRFGRVRLFQGGAGAEAALGDASRVYGSLRGALPLVASCPGTGSTVSPWWWGGCSQPPSSTEKLLRNVQWPAGRSPLPICHCAAHPCGLARCTEGTGTVSVTVSRPRREGSRK